MRIIKDNSNKEKRIRCKYCKSIFKVKLIEIKRGFAGNEYVECPICKETVWITIK